MVALARCIPPTSVSTKRGREVWPGATLHAVAFSMLRNDRRPTSVCPGTRYLPRRPLPIAHDVPMLSPFSSLHNRPSEPLDRRQPQAFQPIPAPGDVTPCPWIRRASAGTCSRGAPSPRLGLVSHEHATPSPGARPRPTAGARRPAATHCGSAIAVSVRMAEAEPGSVPSREPGGRDHGGRGRSRESDCRGSLGGE